MIEQICEREAYNILKDMKSKENSWMPVFSYSCINKDVVDGVEEILKELGYECQRHLPFMLIIKRSGISTS